MPGRNGSGDPMRRHVFFITILFIILILLPSPVMGETADSAPVCGSGGLLFVTLPATLKDPHATTVPTTASGARAAPVTTTAAFGALQLNSVPSGTSVYVDGSLQGTTPVLLRTLSTGSHSITLKLNGYREYTKTVTIPGDGFLEETWTLEPLSPAMITTSAARRQVPAITTPTVTLTTITRKPVIGTTTPEPYRVAVPVTTVPILQKSSFNANLCHYDTATAQCTGICPETGRKCQQVSESGCGEGKPSGTIKCGCVDPASRVSSVSAGLAIPQVNEIPGFIEPEPREKGLADSLTGFATGIFKSKPEDLRSADPRAYTMDTTLLTEAERSTVCPADMFHTVLAFEDPDSAFIDTGTGDQKGHFVWDSADPRIGSVVWQASILPFPPTSDKLSEVPGLVAQGNLPGNQHTFTIDFSENVPTSAETATVWSNRRTMLNLQSNALASFRNQISAGAPKPAASPERAKLLADLNTAVSTSAVRAQNPPASSLISLSAGTKKTSVRSGPATYQIASGVMAPVLSAPSMTKEALASGLPQAQRTFFVRIVPFDQNGNATVSPSNTREVIVGEPVYDTISPWSGWEPVSSFDQSGYESAPVPVAFGDRTYLINAGSNGKVSAGYLDASGAWSGWTPVPGNLQSAQRPVATVYHDRIYLFTRNVQTSNIWYTRMNKNGIWDPAWKEVPGQELQGASGKYAVQLFVRVATVEGGYTSDRIELELDEGYLYLGHNMAMEEILPSQQEKWSELEPGIGQYCHWDTEKIGKNCSIVGTGRCNVGGTGSSCIVSVSNAKPKNPYPPAALLGKKSAEEYIKAAEESLNASGEFIINGGLHRIYIPPEIGGPSISPDNVSAAVAPYRIYFFVRGIDGHIYANWIAIVTDPATDVTFSSLHEWGDISPNSAANAQGIASVPSSDGSRVDVFAYDVEKTGQADTGSIFWFLSGTQKKAPALFRNSLGMTPGTTQLLSSFTGDRTNTVVGNFYGTYYYAGDSNVSWTRTTPYWFAWNSTRPDLTYAEWQVSVRPFDEARPRFNDIGIVARGRLDAGVSDPELVTYGSGLFTANSLPAYAQKVHLFPVSFNTFATPADPANPGVTPYYLRVLAVAPTDTPGSFTAYASRQVEVDWGPPNQLNLSFCTPPAIYHYQYQMPEVRIVGFSPIYRQQPDYECHGVVTTGYDYYYDKCMKETPDGAALFDSTAFGSSKTISKNEYCTKLGHQKGGNSKSGDQVYLCSESDMNLLEKIAEGFRTFFEMLKEIVNAIADAYNGLKASVADFVCKGDPICKLVVEAGINMAMAAMGVPPTIPNFDQLLDKGIGYMAATVAEEMGAPPGTELVIEAALKEAAKELQHKPSEIDPRGIQLDPKYQYQPATLYIEFRNNDKHNRTAPGSFRVKDDWGLFKTMEPDIPYPSISPGNSTVMPVVLREDQWKGFSCSAYGYGEATSGACEELFEKKFNPGWWDKYVNAAEKGATFTLYYQGLTEDFTENMTEKMSHEYGVPLNNFEASGPMDYQKPDCWEDKYGLYFDPYDNGMKRYVWTSDPLTSLSLDSLQEEWGNVKESAG
jgi:hypothetical protein